MDNFYMSYSKLSYFASCPRKFYYKYIEKIPLPSGLSLLSGKAIHRGSKEAYIDMIAGNSTNSSRVVEQTVALFDDEFNKASNSAGGVIEEENGDVKKERDIVAVSQKLYYNDCISKKHPLSAEKEFKFTFNDGLDVIGYIDMVDKEDGIVELKTTGKKQNILFFSPQVILYQHAEKINNAKLEILIKKKNPEIQTVKFESNKEDYLNILANVMQVSLEIRKLLDKQKMYWWQNVGFGCGMCWYKSICFNKKVIE
jgi:CRISPR/Cas system-associated exonuclease Cas4 (RecB family)